MNRRPRAGSMPIPRLLAVFGLVLALGTACRSRSASRCDISYCGTVDALPITRTVTGADAVVVGAPSAADTGKAPADVGVAADRDGVADSGGVADGDVGAEAGRTTDSGVGPMPCTPSCAGVACGSLDGCGGICTLGCICLPSCGAFDCGTSDGCGGICTSGCICLPSCAGVACGGFDGCGGICNTGCICTPSCGAFDCGASDGCGGTCDDGC